MVPIVDHVLRLGTGRGIQAIVVYPMNALANSQEEELKKVPSKKVTRKGSRQLASNAIRGRRKDTYGMPYGATHRTSC